MTLLEKFREYVANMVLKETKDDVSDYVYRMMHSTDGEYSYHPNPGFDDFIKEICEPGDLLSAPDGCVGIRSDDDFWTEAVFPYKFKDLSIQDMVAVLWPNIEDPVFHDDVYTKDKYVWETETP